MLSILSLPTLLLALTSLTLADDSIPGRINSLGTSDAHPFVKRSCEGAPYDNTYCCGALNYCFNGEVCCSSYYCCPGGTTCLGGLKCSPGGTFTATGAPISSAPPAVTSAPAPVTIYHTYYYTITWYYFSYYYTYDFELTTTFLDSIELTTYDYFTASATDSFAANSLFSAYSASVSFSAPASETVPTPLPSLSIPSVFTPSASRTTSAVVNKTTSTSTSTTPPGGLVVNSSSTASSTLPAFTGGAQSLARALSVSVRGWAGLFAMGAFVVPGVLMVVL